VSVYDLDTLAPEVAGELELPAQRVASIERRDPVLGQRLSTGLDLLDEVPPALVACKVDVESGRIEAEGKVHDLRLRAPAGEERRELEDLDRRISARRGFPQERRAGAHDARAIERVEAASASATSLRWIPSAATARPAR